MKLVPVESSLLVAVGYDAATKELEAVYSSGAAKQPRIVAGGVGAYSDPVARTAEGLVYASHN